MEPEEIRQYKQIILIRSDLDFSCGKKCVQVAHASLMGLEHGTTATTAMWRRNGMRKIVLKVPDMKTLTGIVEKAVNHGVHGAIVIDAGLTQLEPGTTTAVGFAPMREDDPKCLDLTVLTSSLKLL
jgi:peptidyl-tRNA hydrolase, PTH2 family